ncbi:uncharacterized protein [Diadema antillarum]|uniref:uncharacterized protein n=1 Tax=Diadema antillarum TaxID=105358 RepID=UPI003A8BA41C
MESKQDTASLIPPQCSAIVDIPCHKSIQFQTTASNGRLPHFVGRNRGSGASGAGRTLAYFILAIAVCGGFALLYAKMACMQNQIYDLQSELSVVVADAGPMDPWDSSEVASYRPGNQDYDYMETDPDEGIHDNEVDHGKRGRRSAGGHMSRHGVRRHQMPSRGHVEPGHITSHLVPTAESVSGPSNYGASEWFRWSSEEYGAHKRGMYMRQDTKLIVPVSGYYFIYSQVTVGDSNIPQLYVGHRIVRKGACGTGTDVELIKSEATQNGTHARDSKHIAGVFYLEKFDELGVRPSFSAGRLHAYYSIDRQNSYFGLILMSSSDTQAPVRCTPISLF